MYTYDIYIYIYKLYWSGCVALTGDHAALAVLHRLGVQRVGGTPRPQCRLFDSGEAFGVLGAWVLGDTSRP